MKLGTKSVLFGVHCFFLHPWFVAVAWWKLYGFPWDPHLWVAFAVHDLGYLGKPNMDGMEGETHVELGARIMAFLFGNAWGDCIPRPHKPGTTRRKCHRGSGYAGSLPPKPRSVPLPLGQDAPAPGPVRIVKHPAEPAERGAPEAPEKHWIRHSPSESASASSAWFAEAPSRKSSCTPERASRP